MRTWDWFYMRPYVSSVLTLHWSLGWWTDVNDIKDQHQFPSRTVSSVPVRPDPCSVVWRWPDFISSSFTCSRPPLSLLNRWYPGKLWTISGSEPTSSSKIKLSYMNMFSFIKYTETQTSEQREKWIDCCIYSFILYEGISLIVVHPVLAVPTVSTAGTGCTSSVCVLHTELIRYPSLKLSQSNLQSCSDSSFMKNIIFRIYRSTAQKTVTVF